MSHCSGGTFAHSRSAGQAQGCTYVLCKTARGWVHPKKVMDHAALRSDLRSQKS